MNEPAIDIRCENCYQYLADLCLGEYSAMDELECWQSAEDEDVGDNE